VNQQLASKGCLPKLNTALAKKNKPVIPPASKNSAIGIRAMDEAMAPWHRPADIATTAKKQQSLAQFITELHTVVASA
jgi:hypothetical protein